jgi:hypothetical protein
VNAEALTNIAALVDADGQIMVGTVKPSENAAFAHDGKKTLEMLQKRPEETLEQLLGRLDAAIATARRSGSRVDEINKPGTGVRYKL